MLIFNNGALRVSVYSQLFLFTEADCGDGKDEVNDSADNQSGEEGCELVGGFAVVCVVASERNEGDKHGDAEADSSKVVCYGFECVVLRRRYCGGTREGS